MQHVILLYKHLMPILASFGPVYGEGLSKVCAECIQRITVSARKDEIVNVCLNEERMAVDGSAPHASLKTDESASLRFKIGDHGRMPGTGSTWHAV